MCPYDCRIWLCPFLGYSQLYSTIWRWNTALLRAKREMEGGGTRQGEGRGGYLLNIVQNVLSGLFPGNSLTGCNRSLMSVTVDSFLSFLELYRNRIQVGTPPGLVLVARPSV